jgi:pimeloyl-ACP methyl ester carboxylesterase
VTLRSGHIILISMALEPAKEASPRSVRADPRFVRALTRPRAAPVTAHAQHDVVVQGMRLRYVDVRPEREDDVPVLLIHGHSSRLEEYDALIPHLLGRRRVLVPDLPGSGYSDKPDRPYDLTLFEDSLLGFLDALGVRRCHLAGGSLGGNLVLRLGHREPDRFARLAAWAPAGAWKPMLRWAIFGSLMKHLRFMFWPSLWVQSRFWYSPRWSGRKKALDDAWTYYREVYGRGFHRMYWEIGVDQALKSLLPHAHRIAQPTYLAYGDRDTGLAMNRRVPQLAKLLPRATLRCFQGARHSLANEVPELLGAEVDAFLADDLAALHRLPDQSA